METPLPPLNEQPVVKNNSLAIAAGWCGIGSVAVSLLSILIVAIAKAPALTICCGVAWLAALVGLVLGIVALVQMKNNPGQKGKGMAITGIVIGGLALLMACIAPFLIVPVLALLGPVIGNTFSKINSNLIVP
jgi:hypothetical protein